MINPNQGVNTSHFNTNFDAPDTKFEHDKPSTSVGSDINASNIEQKAQGATQQIADFLNTMQNHPNQITSQDLSDFSLAVATLGSVYESPDLNQEKKDQIAGIMDELSQISFDGPNGTVPLSQVVADGLLYNDAMYYKSDMYKKKDTENENSDKPENNLDDVLKPRVINYLRSQSKSLPGDLEFLQDVRSGYTAELEDMVNTTQEVEVLTDSDIRNFYGHMNLEKPEWSNREDEIQEHLDELRDDEREKKNSYEATSGPMSTYMWKAGGAIHEVREKRRGRASDQLSNYEHGQFIRFTHNLNGEGDRMSVNDDFMMQRLFEDKNGTKSIGIKSGSESHIESALNSIYDFNK